MSIESLANVAKDDDAVLRLTAAIATDIVIRRAIAVYLIESADDFPCEVCLRVLGPWKEDKGWDHDD